MPKMPGWDTIDVLAGLILVSILAGVVAMAMTIYQSLVDGEPIIAAISVVLGVMFVGYVMKAYNEFKPLLPVAYKVMAIGVITLMAVVITWGVFRGYIQANYGVVGVMATMVVLTFGILFNPYQRKVGVTT